MDKAGTSAAGRPHAGFTLVELMIVVAVVAILASIAYPSYASHTRKARRAKMQAYMMDLAQREAQYLNDFRGYALDVGSTPAATVLGAPASDLAAYYTVSTLARSTPPSFVIRAAASGAQAPDGDLTLDDTGAKSPASSW